LQGFLAARGLKTPLNGAFCRRTITAVQTFLRDSVDSKVAVDGICGPQTERVLESARGEIQRKRPPRSGGTRLVMHTSSRKKSDFYTFEAEAMRLEREYRQAFPNDDVRRVYVRDGKQIADAINKCDPGSIVSWDVLSHSNAGGIHISADLAQPQAASAERQRRHVEYRSGSRRPQSAKDAMFMEEDMRGMYSSQPTMKLVADYFNQLPTEHAAFVDAINFDRFAAECYVELHGCRTVNDAALEADLFIAHLSARLPCDALVVGHTRGSFPQGGRGYRHGEVGVYRAGAELLRTKRETLRLPNASTPGQDDRKLRTTPVPRRRRRTTDTGSRDFKTDWPQDPPNHNPPDPPRTCPPDYPPPNPPNPPRGDDPNYPPPNPPNPPRGDDPNYPPPNPPNPPRGGDPNYPPPNPPNPPRGGDPNYPPPNPPSPPRTPRYPRPNPPSPPRQTTPRYPRPNPPNPPRGNDRNPNDPQQPRQPRGADVPWGAILNGAAVVGGLVLEHKRQKNRDRDRRGSNPRVPNNPNPRNPRIPSPRDNRIPTNPRDIGSTLIGGGDRGGKLSRSAANIFSFGRR
jgi:hypothetical protein